MPQGVDTKYRYFKGFFLKPKVSRVSFFVNQSLKKHNDVQNNVLRAIMAFTITIHTDISECNLHILAKVLLFIVYTDKEGEIRNAAAEAIATQRMCCGYEYLNI